MEPVPVRTLAAWLDDATHEALEACDDAMMIPGAAPNSTREILEAGYRLYHSPGYKSAGLPTEAEPDDVATFAALTDGEDETEEIEPGVYLTADGSIIMGGPEAAE